MQSCTRSSIQRKTNKLNRPIYNIIQKACSCYIKALGVVKSKALRFNKGVCACDKFPVFDVYLTHCDLVTSYGDRGRGEHGLR